MMFSVHLKKRLYLSLKRIFRCNHCLARLACFGYNISYVPVRRASASTRKMTTLSKKYNYVSGVVGIYCSWRQIYSVLLFVHDCGRKEHAHAQQGILSLGCWSLTLPLHRRKTVQRNCKVLVDISLRMR